MPAPTAPTDLRLYQYPSGTSAQLVWTDRSTDEDGFVVERRLEGEADFTSVGVANAVNGVNSAGWFTDTGLPNDAVIAYRVRAVNPLGSSGYSNVITVPTGPAAPTGLAGAAVAGTDNQIRLTWTDASRRESDFRVYRRNPGATSFTYIATVAGVTGAGGVATYTDTGATAGAAHEYYVKAYNAAGESGESNRVTIAANAAVTAPAALRGLYLWGYPSGAALRLYFSDASTNEDAFLVERKSEDEGDYSVVATLPAAVGAGTTVYYDAAGLAADTSFSFRVRARNGIGDSDPSNVLTVVSAPVAPTGLTAAAVPGTDNQIRLTWTDSSRRESGFRVYRKDPGNSHFAQVGTVPGVSGTGTSVSYVDGGATAGSAYEYYVTAYNDAGQSGESNRATATANPTAAAPAAPSELRLWGYASATSIQLRFRDNSTNEAGFVVERKAEDDAEYAAAATAPSAAGVGNYPFATVSGLAPDTRYELRVRARNAVGDSARATWSRSIPPGSSGRSCGGGGGRDRQPDPTHVGRPQSPRGGLLRVPQGPRRQQLRAGRHGARHGGDGEHRHVHGCRGDRRRDARVLRQGVQRRRRIGRVEPRHCHGASRGHGARGAE
jgi:titin